MARVLPILSVCIALLALGLSLMPRDPVPTPTIDFKPSGPSDDVLELRKRVELLEDDSRNMWDRVVAMERSGVLVAANDGGSDPALFNEVLRLRDEVRALSNTSLAANDGGRAAIADMMREIQTDQARERFSERAQFRAQRAVEMADKWRGFFREVALPANVQHQLEERLAMEEQLAKAMFPKADGTMPPAETIKNYNTTRRETDKLMRTALEEPQYEKYQGMRREERGR